MHEPKDHTPDTGSGTDPIASAGAHLSPIQQAWSDYVNHATACPQCRSLDAGRCTDAERLHRTYSETSSHAFDGLADETL